MRLEATVPDSRGQAVLELADQLGASRSQIIDEALSPFLKAVLEIRRGRRLVTLDPTSAQPACELATPTLSALEWAQSAQREVMPAASVARMQTLVDNAPRPSERLKAAARRTNK